MRASYIPFRILVLITVLGTMLLGCEDEEFCRNGKGPVEIEEFVLPTFDGVQLRRSAAVFIQQGEEQRVQVEAERNVFEELDLEVRNGILIIDLDRCFFSRDIQVFLTLTEPLSELVITGSGNMISEGQLIAADNLYLEIKGSGDISLDLDAIDIKTLISGSGDIELSGVADSHEVQISGSGDLDAYDLTVQDYEVRISGSGKAEIFVNGGTLNANINGSGDILYGGTPETINSQITGSGNIIRID